MMQDLSIIEEAHAAKVLVTCLRQGDIAKSVLYGILQKNNQVIQARIEKLVSARLLTETEQKVDGAWKKMISLTPKGRRVADHLQAIEEILAE